jgi:cation diffusion facilitator CzcD-associated flavoprotein CzcO
MPASHVDVLIVGAGLSGIGAAHHLQTRCPGKTYLILEGRERLGGTWDLFRYPGIRSDSDMYTLGYSFRPWKDPHAIAGGDAILAYVRETAESAGIDRRIRYRHRVERARWSSDDARWTVEVRDLASGEPVSLTCGFLYVCAGYYDYDAGYTPRFAGRERFRGRIVHPQHWTPDIVYDGARVVVIGSGATAVTLVPELARRAAHVTMLQRSPTYIVSRPRRDAIADWLRDHIPERAAYSATRWKNVLLGQGFYELCRRYPERMKRMLVEQARRELRGASDISNFTPSYRPWDQRLCLVPDGDLFEAVRDRRASVVTDHIEAFTEGGIALRSGAHLDADLVVTATGLQLKFFGGIAVEVDGARVETSRVMIYKGMMCSDVPNCAFATGYTNASWTLKVDLVSTYVCRLLGYMDAHGYTICCPRRVDPTIRELPLIDFTSGYVVRSIDQLPRQGSAAPWRLRQNYPLDRLLLERARVDDPAMEFSRSAAPRAAPGAAARSA